MAWPPYNVTNLNLIVIVLIKIVICQIELHRFIENNHPKKVADINFNVFNSKLKLLFVLCRWAYCQW